MLIKDVPKRDWEQLFEGGLILHKEEGWGVISSFDILMGIVYFVPIGSELRIEYPFNDDTFSLTPPTLGYVKYKDGVVYLSRIPKRIMKAVITSSNLAINSFSGRGVPFVNLVNDVQIGRYLNGSYPSLAEAYGEVCKGQRAVPFDRQFAISEKDEIIYKEELIVGTHKDGKLIFFPKYRTLLPMIGDNCGKALQILKHASKERTLRG